LIVATLVSVRRLGRLTTVTLDDAPRRNALGDAMFEALEGSLDREASLARAAGPGAIILRLRAEGSAFCAGFDLGACAGVDGQRVLARFLERLSRVVRQLRRGPWVAVAEVQGAALAGGCALVAACDFAITARSATLGYPVHRLGVSPAVNAPLVVQAMGAGGGRALLLSGELLQGDEAARRGLVTRAVDDGALATTVDALCERLLTRGPVALAETRRWLDRLDGSGDDGSFDAALRASLALCCNEECERMLRQFWASRQGR